MSRLLNSYRKAELARTRRLSDATSAVVPAAASEQVVRHQRRAKVVVTGTQDAPPPRPFENVVVLSGSAVASVASGDGDRRPPASGVAVERSADVGQRALPIIARPAQRRVIGIAGLVMLLTAVAVGAWYIGEPGNGQTVLDKAQTVSAESVPSPPAAGADHAAARITATDDASGSDAQGEAGAAVADAEAGSSTGETATPGDSVVHESGIPGARVQQGFAVPRSESATPGAGARQRSRSAHRPADGFFVGVPGSSGGGIADTAPGSGGASNPAVGGGDAPSGAQTSRSNRARQLLPLTALPPAGGPSSGTTASGGLTAGSGGASTGTPASGSNRAQSLLPLPGLGAPGDAGSVLVPDTSVGSAGSPTDNTSGGSNRAGDLLPDISLPKGSSNSSADAYVAGGETPASDASGGTARAQDLLPAIALPSAGSDTAPPDGPSAGGGDLPSVGTAAGVGQAQGQLPEANLPSVDSSSPAGGIEATAQTENPPVADAAEAPASALDPLAGIDSMPSSEVSPTAVAAPDPGANRVDAAETPADSSDPAQAASSVPSAPAEPVSPQPLADPAAAVPAVAAGQTGDTQASAASQPSTVGDGPDSADSPTPSTGTSPASIATEPAASGGVQSAANGPEVDASEPTGLQATNPQPPAPSVSSPPAAPNATGPPGSTASDVPHQAAQTPAATPADSGPAASLPGTTPAIPGGTTSPDSGGHEIIDPSTGTYDTYTGSWDEFPQIWGNYPITEPPPGLIPEPAPPAPLATTESSIAIHAGLDGVFVVPNPEAYIASVTETETKASATLDDRRLSGHIADATALGTIQPHDLLVNGGPADSTQAIATIQLDHLTRAEALTDTPLGAWAKASTLVGFDGVLAVPGLDGASLDLAWEIDRLAVRSEPTNALSVLHHLATVRQRPSNDNAAQELSTTIGFSILSQNGMQLITSYDLPGSTAIEDWLGSISNGDPSTEVAAGPVVEIPLTNQFVDPSSGLPVVRLSLDVAHSEYSVESPVTAVRRVAEQAGSIGDEGTARWNTATRRLEFDPVAINLVSDDNRRTITDHYRHDPLVGGHLEIDPLIYAGALGEDRYFIGNEVRLVGADGNVLFWASLPTVKYDDSLVGDQGFNLFASLLNLDWQAGDGSTWLDQFGLRMDDYDLFMPELFIGLDIPETLGDEWLATSFETSFDALLSFASSPAIVDGESKVSEAAIVESRIYVEQSPAIDLDALAEQDDLPYPGAEGAAPQAASLAPAEETQSMAAPAAVAGEPEDTSKTAPSKRSVTFDARKAAPSIAVENETASIGSATAPDVSMGKAEEQPVDAPGGREPSGIHAIATPQMSAFAVPRAFGMDSADSKTAPVAIGLLSSYPGENSDGLRGASMPSSLSGPGPVPAMMRVNESMLSGGAEHAVSNSKSALPVSEPSTELMLATGLFLLLAAQRSALVGRRRQHPRRVRDR